MKVDQPIAGDEQQPGYFARYRYYTAGKVPRGFAAWAERRLSLRRWIVVFSLLQVVACLVATALLAVLGDSFGILTGDGWVALAAAVMLPLAAARARNEARRSLAPPPAHEVLKGIGEPV